jgi:hypothetical protein
LGGEEPIILPVDLDSITWEEIKLEKLATPVAYFLKISVRSTLLILQHLQLMPPDIASTAHGTFWMSMVKLLFSLDTDHNVIHCWEIGHHQRKGQLFAAISHESLVTVLLHERPNRTPNKLRAIAATLIRSFLDRSFPTMSEAEKKDQLLILVRDNFVVFPQSLPLARDRKERWWRVGEDPDHNELESTLGWMVDHLSLSMERIPALSTVTLNSEVISTGWFLLNRYLQSPLNVSFCSTEQKLFFRAMMLLVLATSLEQTRKQNFDFAPYIHWGEWRLAMTIHLDPILKRLLLWELLVEAAPGTPPKETLFNLYQVPEGFYRRLEDLRRLFICRHIIAPPPIAVAGEVGQVGEAAPDDDGEGEAAEHLAEIEAEVEAVPPVVRRRRRHADYQIAHQVIEWQGPQRVRRQRN